MKTTKTIILILLLTNLMILGGIFMSETSYAFCGSKCKHPVYTKSNFITIKQSVTAGSTGSISSATISYPSGCTRSNLFLIGIKMTSGSLPISYTQSVTSYTSGSSIYYDSSIKLTMQDNAMYLNGRMPFTDTTGTVELLFIKIG